MRDEFATRHGDLRLMQAANGVDKSMTEVWMDAIPCEVSGHGYDEARISPEHEIVLLKENDRIITCLRGTHGVTIEGDNLESYLDGAIESQSKDLSDSNCN